MIEPVALVLAGGDRIASRSLRVFLESFRGLRVAGIAASGEELLERVAQWRPRIVILDPRMPGSSDALHTARRLHEIAPGIRIIAVTDELRILNMLRDGVCGCVRKSAAPEVLLAVVRAVS